MQLIPTIRGASVALAMAGAAFAHSTPATAQGVPAPSAPTRPVVGPLKMPPLERLDRLVASPDATGAGLAIDALSTGCISSTNRYLGNSIAAAADGETRTITITGVFRYFRPVGGGVKKDCQKRRNERVTLSDLAPGEYRLVYGGDDLGTVTVGAGAQGKTFAVPRPWGATRPHRITRGAALFAGSNRNAGSLQRGVPVRPSQPLSVRLFDDREEGQLELHIADTGCISSSARPDGDSVTVRVDEEGAMIHVDGALRYTYPANGIGTADCMGRRSKIVEVPMPAGGTYRLLVNSEDRGAMTLPSPDGEEIVLRSKP